MSFWCFVRFHPLREIWAKMERKCTVWVSENEFFFLPDCPSYSFWWIYLLCWLFIHFFNELRRVVNCVMVVLEGPVWPRPCSASCLAGIWAGLDWTDWSTGHLQPEGDQCHSTSLTHGHGTQRPERWLWLTGGFVMCFLSHTHTLKLIDMNGNVNGLLTPGIIDLFGGGGWKIVIKKVTVVNNCINIWKTWKRVRVV